MSHNPDVAHAFGEVPFQALAGHAVLRIEGRDAVAFAHAQFMNDVAGLGDRHWQWNGWLNPKGRVLALFALLRLDAQSLWLWLPDVDAVQLVEDLRRFVFRSKVTLLADAAVQVRGALAASRWASGAHFSGDPAAGFELDLCSAGGGRSLRIAPTAAGTGTAADAVLPDSTGTAADDALPDRVCDFAAEWAGVDLQHGLPRLPAGQSGLWTPQQLSLDRLRAYSVRKGCYPGQEIVARTHFLGQAKRGLALFACDAPVTIGAAVQAGGQSIGSVVSVAATESACLVLAVLPIEREASLHADGHALRELPLVDGLAR